MSRPRYRPLRLVVGGPGAGPSGIQEGLVEETRRLKSGDPLRPVTILVGSNYQRLHLQRLLAIRLGGHANISFLLLKDLARAEGARPLVGRGRRRLPDPGREILLQEAVSALSHGTYFDRIAGKEGFLESLSATIRDLKEAMIDPAALRAGAGALRASAPRAATESLSAGKLDDLADLFEAYDDLLRDRRFYDEEDLMRSAVSRVADPGGPPVLLYGFYDLNWLQRSLIQEVMSFREGVVFFPCEEGPEFDYARGTLEWFESWIPAREDRPERRSDGPTVEFLSAPGESRETLEVTRWLIRQCRENSFPMGQLGLVYRSADPYGDLVPEVMDRAGPVPRFLSSGSPVSSESSARVLLTLLEARDESFSRRSVIDFLTVTTPGSRAALWDRVSRRAGVVKGIGEWQEKLDRLARRSGLEGGPVVRDAQAAPELRERVAELAEAAGSVPEEGSWGHMTDTAIGLMRRFAPDEASCDRVAEVLSRLGALDEVSTPVGIETFVRFVRRLLERDGAVRGEGEFQRSGLFVGSVMDARLLSFSAVAVVGLVERCFPLPPRQDPILLDEERRQINDLLGGERLPIKTRRLEEERLLFRLACSSASERLLLSYPRLDPATARPRAPSPFLLAAASGREGEHLSVEDLEGLPQCRRVSLSSPAPPDPAEAILGREYDLSVIGQVAEDPAMRGPVASFLHSRPILHRALEAEEARWGVRRFTSFDGVILRPNLVEALRRHPAREKPISASSIEDYASCPLAFFMKRILCLKALEDPETAQTIDPLEKGRLVHEILAEVYTRLRDQGALPLRADRMAEAGSLLREVALRRFESAGDSNVTGNELPWEVEREAILLDLNVFLWKEALTESERIPAHFELAYGMAHGEHGAPDRASIPDPVPFEIGPGRSVRLEGMIDRVEIDPAGRTASVTDYKTGRMDRYRTDSLQGGRSVQLPLYMIAAEEILRARHPGIRVEEASYRSVTGKGGFRRISFGAGALEARRDELARAVGTVLNGIEGGVFFAWPAADTCRRCDYKMACGEGRDVRLERKKGDPTAQDFIAMAEADR